VFFTLKQVLLSLFTPGGNLRRSQIRWLERLDADGMPILCQELHLISSTLPMDVNHHTQCA